ncbi:methyltransferase [Asticcacaulis sp. DW145]|uniref:Methyltransferase n=1 Tax=Asticcacaulis currens TaxID=2984210 RepID=A0ABT5IEA9_9CAUL|nr:methyltransferase [Asticcacaulis currens]MDC7694537.1 methyltransferase [Asticcacaulis currens]BEV10962.1 methyltransferase [Asticcacaulis sp. DW145]
MPETAFSPPADALPTTLLGGRVRLWQPAKGYRIGMDGALLAAGAAGIIHEKRPHSSPVAQPSNRAQAGPGDPSPLSRRPERSEVAVSALELGCGVGGVILSLGARCPQVRAIGIERDAATFALTEVNLAQAGGDHRAIHGDIGMGYRAFDLPRFDLVLSNPPYFDDPETLRAPHELKRPAWIADDGLQAWLDFAQAAVVDGGEIVFIHRADRLADILSGLPKCGSFIIRPIQPFADKEAKRILVRAKRLGKAQLRLLPPLILHDEGERKHTPEVEAILRGEAELGW